jgi:hypothetical protein
MPERRQSERVKAGLYAIWDLTRESVSSGNVVHLSQSGCFVESRVHLNPDHPINIMLRIPTERWLSIPAKVTHVDGGEGFGVSFSSLHDLDRRMLDLLVEYYRSELLSASASERN